MDPFQHSLNNTVFIDCGRI